MTAVSKKQDVKKTKEFQDNQLAMIVFGAHNSNIHRLEKKLDVNIKVKGNQATVEGKEDLVAQTFAALDKLYAVAKRAMSTRRTSTTPSTCTPFPKIRRIKP